MKPGQLDGTRWSNESPMGKAFQSLFAAPEIHEAMKTFQTALRKHGLSSTEVSLRRLYHHSELRDGDGIIIGASRDGQLEDNLGAFEKGPLESDVLSAINQFWASLKKVREDVL